MMTQNYGSESSDHSLIEIRESVTVANNMQSLSVNTHEDELLASLIGTKLDQLPPSSIVPCCIFRVPYILRRHVDEDNFVPNLVSIGPFHHGKDNLQTMEETKLLYLQCLLDRKPTPEISLQNFVKEIRSLEQDCRNCYNEKLHDLSSDKFVEMMVVDGCFVIELFRKFSGEVSKDKRDPVFSNTWMHTALVTDLLLLENKLPWRVLNCLFRLTCEDGKLPLTKLALNYFEKYCLVINPSASAALENKHLLSLLGNCLLGPCSDKTETSDLHIYRHWIPSATALEKGGIKIQFGYTNQAEMLNVTFRDGVLEIPPVIFEKNGESLFRNLIAYEHCEPTNKRKLISYAVLLDDLIKRDEDLTLLIKKGIIRNRVRDDIKRCFKTVFSGALSDSVGLHKDFAYAKIYSDMMAYCDNPYHHGRYLLVHHIFKDPLSVINITFAVALVTVLTGLQTVYSVLSYYYK